MEHVFAVVDQGIDLSLFQEIPSLGSRTWLLLAIQCFGVLVALALLGTPVRFGGHGWRSDAFMYLAIRHISI
jgi:hypothetical protein